MANDDHVQYCLSWANKSAQIAVPRPVLCPRRQEPTVNIMRAHTAEYPNAHHAREHSSTIGVRTLPTVRRVEGNDRLLVDDNEEMSPRNKARAATLWPWQRRELSLGDHAAMSIVRRNAEKHRVVDRRKRLALRVSANAERTKERLQRKQWLADRARGGNAVAAACASPQRPTLLAGTHAAPVRPATAAVAPNPPAVAPGRALSARLRRRIVEVTASAQHDTGARP
jgi:hypothetical protein